MRTGVRHGAAAQIDLELTFETWMPPSGAVERQTSVDSMKYVTVTSAGHFEQAGRYHGSIRVGGRQAAFEGVGVRDKTWGPVDQTMQHSSAWFAVGFAPNLAIGARAMSLGVKGMHSGWVLKDGQVRALKSCRVESEYEGRSVKSSVIRLVDATDDPYEITAEPLYALPMREGRARITQTMTRFRYGEHETLGLAEYVENG